MSTGINPVLENMQQTAMELSLFYWIIVFGFSFFSIKKMLIVAMIGINIIRWLSIIYQFLQHWISLVKVLKECKECDFSTNSAKEMRLHVRSHVNLSCTKCEYTADKRKQLRLHLAKAHGIKEEHT